MRGNLCYKIARRKIAASNWLKYLIYSTVVLISYKQLNSKTKLILFTQVGSE